MPSRAYTSFLRQLLQELVHRWYRFNALSGLYLISTLDEVEHGSLVVNGFNALSGLYLISTSMHRRRCVYGWTFQCPLGLIPHFYARAFLAARRALAVSMPSRAYTSFLLVPNLIYFFLGNCGFNALSGLYLISTWMQREDLSRVWECFNALSGLYLISTVPLQKPRFYAVSRTCFCRYLSEYSDNSCFSCMLTFWTYLMRCNYPRHWIKYSTNYNRCHPIFSLSW